MIGFHAMTHCLLHFFSGPVTKHSPVRKDKDVISITELSGDSIQYESLNEGHSSEVSAQQG